MNYKGLRIASVNGQGAEGCGVQRTSAELQLWAKKVGAIVDFYSFDVKKYSRGAGHDMNIISFKPKDFESITEKLNNNYDIVMFMSYPHTKYDHDHSKKFYHTLYKGIQKPLKVMFIHEIHKMNIDKVSYLVPMLYNADMVFHFDIDTWFSTTVDKLGIKHINDRLNKYTLWINFDELDAYRQRYINNKKAGLVSVTRWSSLKNIGRSIEIMGQLKKLDKNQDCFVKGVERSIGAKFDILDRKDIFYHNNGGRVDGNGPVDVYGPVTRNEGLDCVASHLFSSSFFSLPNKPENYGNRMEYTQIEIIGVGTIPIFDMHWAKNNKLNDGRTYWDVPFSAIYTDGTNIKEVAKTLIEISKNPEVQKDYLDTSYQLVKNEFDADIVIPRTIELIKSKGKNTEQLSDYEIYQKLVNKDFADSIKELEEAGEMPVLGIGEFENQEVSKLVGSKQVLVKKCKEKKVKEKKEKKTKTSIKKDDKKIIANVKSKAKTKSLF